MGAWLYPESHLAGSVTHKIHHISPGAKSHDCIYVVYISIAAMVIDHAPMRACMHMCVRKCVTVSV